MQLSNSPYFILFRRKLLYLESKLELMSISDNSSKDPVRHPNIQTVYENEMKRNYSSSLKVMKVQLTKIIKQDGRSNNSNN